jgi:hypothetical protein
VQFTSTLSSSLSHDDMIIWCIQRALLRVPVLLFVVDLHLWRLMLTL